MAWFQETAQHWGGFVLLLLFWNQKSYRAGSVRGRRHCLPAAASCCLSLAAATRTTQKSIFWPKPSLLFLGGCVCVYIIFLAFVLSIHLTGTSADVTKYFISVGVGDESCCRCVLFAPLEARVCSAPQSLCLHPFVLPSYRGVSGWHKFCLVFEWLEQSVKWYFVAVWGWCSEVKPCNQNRWC